jgi:hypothetical protein
MAGLVPAIHVLRADKCCKDVDARHKAGHDNSLIQRQWETRQSTQGARSPGAPPNSSLQRLRF